MTKALQANIITENNKSFSFQVSLLEEDILFISEKGSSEEAHYQSLHLEVSAILEANKQKPLGLILDLKELTGISKDAKGYHFTKLKEYCSNGQLLHVSVIAPEIAKMITKAPAAFLLENNMVSYHENDTQAIQALLKKQNSYKNSSEPFKQCLQENTQDILQKFTERNEELRQKNEELDYFVYSVSHDLRAPVATIQGLVQVLKIEEDNPSLVSYLEMVNIQIARIEKYIREINEYAWNSKLGIEVEEVNFENIINETKTSLQYLEGADSVEWEVEVQQECFFYSDKQRIHLILMHLCANSIKYRKLESADNKLKICINSDAKSATISVIDNGIGIEKKYMDNIFDMFFTTSDRTKGNGLGLYTTLQTVKKLEGKIDVLTQPEEGSTFTISIPGHSSPDQLK
ncbi:HAMP domain-containing sensor histidine kinase [Flammeovirgaceae bacterium SG7u.111]|nr:HAMP domain-containing sensor histidine kinase [Flammeovirgaceae bacterium SG7u.132]WPO34178.1 HAMP domain-containing sensor histidine kinase [Flammeovirgaceae bacterium SG7u.111]